MGEDDLTALADDGQEPGQGVQVVHDDLEKKT
jgi:hypothetical protein